MSTDFDCWIRIEKKPGKLSERWIRNMISKILRALGWKKAVLSLSLVGDSKIQKMNRQYLGHDRPTDVIAFSQLEGKKAILARGVKPCLGDLIISVETTRRQAKMYGNSFSYELAFYLCHGILHLMGWDDKTPKQAKRMETKQKSILKKIMMGKHGDPKN